MKRYTGKLEASGTGEVVLRFRDVDQETARFIEYAASMLDVDLHRSSYDAGDDIARTYVLIYKDADDGVLTIIEALSPGVFDFYHAPFGVAIKRHPKRVPAKVKDVILDVLRELMPIEAPGDPPEEPVD